MMWHNWLLRSGVCRYRVRRLKAPSHYAGAARDVAVEFSRCRKRYNMAGWRIGFMVVIKPGRRAGAH